VKQTIDKHSLNPDAHQRFTRRELRRSRCLLRRLNFLEEQAAGHPDPNGYVLLEIESLRWVLTEMDLLPEHVSGNRRTG
jgi:hypothetical protein